MLVAEFVGCLSLLMFLKSGQNMRPASYSQTRIKETHGADRKEILLSIVLFISCPVNLESLSCVKAEE